MRHLRTEQLKADADPILLALAVLRLGEPVATDPGQAEQWMRSTLQRVFDPSPHLARWTGRDDPVTKPPAADGPPQAMVWFAADLYLELYKDRHPRHGDLPGAEHLQHLLRARAARVQPALWPRSHPGSTARRSARSGKRIASPPSRSVAADTPPNPAPSRDAPPTATGSPGPPPAGRPKTVGRHGWEWSLASTATAVRHAQALAKGIAVTPCAKRHQLWADAESATAWLSGATLAKPAVKTALELCAHCEQLTACAELAQEHRYDGIAAGAIYRNGKPVR